MEPTMKAWEDALAALRAGNPVLVYDADGREEETDLVVASAATTPAVVHTLRREAGGLICVTLPQRVAATLGLPRMEEALERLAPQYPLLGELVEERLPYDARSAFSITVNHRETYTGVTDRDRARTVVALARITREALERGDGWARRAFVAEFRSPGHIPLLIAEEPLLEGRRGHTELATGLALLAGVVPSVVLCEMMGDGGDALSKAEAKNYARDRALAFVEGEDILRAWRRWSGSWLPASLTSST